MAESDEQWAFLRALAQLVTFAAVHGYKLTGGVLWDPPGSGSGRSERSFHRRRLAVDLNLFVAVAGGRHRYTRSTADHEPLGEFWESLGGTWGGRFSKPDGNHYSWGE